MKDFERTRDLLSLVGYEVSVEAINRWTEKERQQAAEWAALTQLAASDNDVCVPKRPAVLKEPPWTGPVQNEGTIWEMNPTVIA